MKRLLIALLTLTVVMVNEHAVAQSSTSYFMEGSYFRTEMNPALRPTRGYLALPGMSGIGVDVSSNFLSVDNFFYKNGDNVVTALHSSVASADFLNKLPNIEKLGIDLNVNILGVGFYSKHTYWNVGINVRSQSDIALSKDLFRALKTLGNGTYNLSDTSISSNNFAEVYVGSSFPVCKWATVGVRAKFLLGIANASTDIHEIVADVSPESITARLRGTVRANGILFDSSMAHPGEKIDTDVIRTNDIGFLLGNVRSFGAAIDAGFEFNLLDDHLRVSAAITDLGFIRWHKKSHIIAKADADFYFNGVNLDTGDADLDSNFEATWSDTPTKGYTTMLNYSFNVGVEYTILRNRISFGLLSHTEFCNSLKFTELTASVNFRPLNWLSATFSHTFLNQNKPGVFGFALNIHPSVINIFVGADYLDFNMVKYKNIPIPRNMNSISLYAGIGFNFGRPKVTKEAK